MTTPILETERLLLRPLCLKDAEEIYKNWASDPEVAEYMIWNVHDNVQVTKDWLKYVELNTASNVIYDWGFVRKSDQVLIGSGGIYYKEDRGMFNLGYNIMKACWHQGYTTEAAERILKFATEELHQKKLFAYHAKDNPNSGKVLEKVGFRYANDTAYDKMDGTKHFEAKEYLYELSNSIFSSITNKSTAYEKYEYAENILDTKLLDKDKLSFTVLDRIVNRKCRRVITDHKSYVLCHTCAPYPVWIWTTDDITEERLKEVWEGLKIEFPLEEGFRYITKYFVADYLIRRSKEENKYPLKISLNMYTYICQSPIAPSKILEGRMCLATVDDLSEVSTFLYLFKLETGVDIEEKEQCYYKAKHLIEQGRLHLWKNDQGKNVAMCSYNTDETLGKITHVYTIKEERRKGYAMRLVYEITCIVKSKGRLPMLYTDADYEASNDCYKQIGFQEKGRLCTVAAYEGL